MCASHRGESCHTEVLASIASKMGLELEILHCGITEPFSRSSAINLYKSGESLTPLHCNCSGKHLGMILVCRQKGYPIEGYYTIEHPVQHEALEILSRFANPSTLGSEYAFAVNKLSYAIVSNPEMLSGKTPSVLILY